MVIRYVKEGILFKGPLLNSTKFVNIFQGPLFLGYVFVYVLKRACYLMSNHQSHLTMYGDALSVTCKLNSWVKHIFVGNTHNFSSSQLAKHINYPMFRISKCVNITSACDNWCRGIVTIHRFNIIRQKIIK